MHPYKDPTQLPLFYQDGSDRVLKQSSAFTNSYSFNLNTHAYKLF
jgi:hypothetical protein